MADLQCPRCSNEYLTQVHLAKYDGSTFRIASTMQPKPDSPLFSYFQCPACGMLFNNASYAVNFKLSQEKERVDSNIKSGEVSRVSDMTDPIYRKLHEMQEQAAMMLTNLSALTATVAKLVKNPNMVESKQEVVTEEPVVPTKKGRPKQQKLERDGLLEE